MPLDQWSNPVLIRYAMTFAAVATASPGILRHDVPVERFAELAARPAFAPVVRLVNPAGGTAGSGVLISPRWVLTAAHVVSARDSGHYVVVSGDRQFRVDSIVMHPNYHAAKDSSFVDLALFRLAEPVTGVMAALIDDRPLQLGTRFVHVGYGRVARAFDTTAAPGTRNGFENTLDTLDVGGPRSYIGADLDHPTDASMSVSGSPAALPLEGVLNGGDSGGGLFVEVNGSWRLAAISATSRHSRARLEQFGTYGYYGSVSFWTRLDGERDWIARTVGPRTPVARSRR